MTIYKITDPEFIPYGKVLEGFDVTSLLKTLVETTPKPEDGVVYVPSDPALEADPVFEQFRDGAFGGMPIQIGYCNGSNNVLDCVEYHRDSEVNVPADDVILLLGQQKDIVDGKYDTANVKAFYAPAGVPFEFYGTSLHNAPCAGVKGQGFRNIVILPKGTNTEKPDFAPKNEEDTWLWARNNWSLAHPDSNAAKAGAYVGMVGDIVEAL